MNVMTNAVRGVVKLGLLAGAIVFAAVGVGQGSQPASAANTSILLSYSDIAPIHAPTIIVNPSGLPRELYAWVVNADNATGVSGYHLEINFDSSVLTAAGGSHQVDIIDGQVDVDQSGTVGADDDLFNVLLQLVGGGSDRVNIIDGHLDVDQSSLVDAADDLAGVSLLWPAGTPETVDIIDGQVDVDQSSAVDAADDLANALLLTATGMAPDPPLWLGNGGRSASCPAPTIGEGIAYMDCVSLGSQTGATGTGLLGKVTIAPGPVWQISSLDLTGTYLLDTPPPPDFALSQIPVTLQPTTVIFMHCANFNGDLSVDLFGDILGVILQFGKVSTDPDWDPMFDINKDGAIDLFGDILGTIMQFGLPCNRPA